MNVNTSAAKPVIQLNLPDPAPLRATLAALDDFAVTVQRLADEKAGLEKTIEEYISGENATDQSADANLRMAGNQIRVQTIPNIISRLMGKKYALADDLVSGIKAFEQALAIEGSREYEATLHSIEGEIKHRVPGRYLFNGREHTYAGLLASKFPEVESIPQTVEGLSLPPFFQRNNQMVWGDSEEQCNYNFTETVDAAKKRAAALLAILERVAEVGRFGKSLDQIREKRAQTFAEEKKQQQARSEEDARRAHQAGLDSESGKAQTAAELLNLRNGLNEDQKESLETMRASGVTVD